MEKLDKLIELLNEHRVELLHGNIQNKPMRYSYGNYVFGLSDLTEQNCILLVISKQYGFIKWLVDNNKIDNKKIDTRLVRYVESHYDEEGYWMENSYEDYELYESLLMLLAISDTPIDDLISYLK